MKVLKLSANFEPLEVIDYKDAFKLIFTEKAEVVKEYENLTIRTPRIKYKVPSVVRLVNSFRRPKRKIRFSKHNVLLRDRNRCMYCGEVFNNKELTLDHIIPRSQGGKTCWTNLVACCEECNRRKKNRTPERAGMRLIQAPTEPDWIPFLITFSSKSEIPNDWLDFCFWVQ